MQYERAFMAAGGGFCSYVVVEAPEDGMEIFKLLRDQDLGRVNLLALQVLVSWPPHGNFPARLLLFLSSSSSCRFISHALPRQQNCAVFFIAWQDATCLSTPARRTCRSSRASRYPLLPRLSSSRGPALLARGM